jgi:hypothetical protein
MSGLHSEGIEKIKDLQSKLPLKGAGYEKTDQS